MADEVKHSEGDCQLPPSKRKPDSFSVDANDDEVQPKKSKTETETTDMADGELEQPRAFELPDEADADDDEEDEEEHSNGEAEVDKKGKSVVARDDKGKGKMVEEDDDSSDDEIVGGDDSSEDDDDDDSGNEDDSDLSDDPLAEVDLDNILPSRTRRRSAASSPGICLGKGKDN